MSSKQRKREEELLRQKIGKRRRLFIYTGLAGIVIVLAGGSLFFFTRQTAATETVSLAKCDAVATLRDEGNAHLNLGETYQYQTNPPTSGPHNPEPWPAGIYTTPILAMREVHSL